jgi:hypothetical protein
MLVAILVISALALGTIVLIGWPLLSAPDRLRDGSRTRRERELEDALNRSLDAIDEIDFDHRAGHLSDADFAALDGNERARALELMRRKDSLEDRG